MTSANLSLSNRISNHKKYITRTLWSSILGFLVMAIYYILGTILYVSRAMNYGKVNHQTTEYMRHEMHNAVTRIMGLDQVGWLIIVVIAVAFAFQGFAYLFDTKKIDFYLSQPTTRAERIRKNYFNAFSTFIIMYFIVNVIALLIAACMGAVNGAVLLSVALEFVRVIILFFTVYNISVLAIMLCGNMLIALIVLSFFAAISGIFGYELAAYKSIFFATFASRGGFGIIGSPIYDRLMSLRILYTYSQESIYNTTVASVWEGLSRVFSYELDTLITGIIAFVFVLVFSRFRKAEDNSKTVIYRPFRWLLKIVSCIVIGLGCGFIFYSMNEYVWTGTKFFVFMFIIMVLATILSGCIIEAILDGNIKSFLNGKAQTVMALAITSLIFVIFSGDLVGYDSYIPDASKVESCALLSTGYGYRIYRENSYKDFEDSPEEYMYITDIDNFNKLVKAGMANQKKWKKLDNEGNYQDLGWQDTVLYRLKNGKKVYRTIMIPYDIDENVISAIIDSKEYREGYFEVYHDDMMRDYDNRNPKTRSVSYTSAGDRLSSSDITYAELSDAYRKDVEASFTFEMASTTSPIGQIEYDNNTYNGYSSCTLNVYECYTNTIALLKKYDIYMDSELAVEMIDSIEVTNYYPGYDVEKQSMEEIDTNVDSKSFVYTDKDQIRDIMENVINNDYYSRWYRSKELQNTQFSIVVNARSYISTAHSITGYYSFEMGKVPDFVYTDTQ